MELKVQNYLRSGKKLQDLEHEFRIAAKQHPSYPSLWLLKYDQIASQMSEAIVQECRGIILDESQDWKVICHSFDKFFNYGEGPAARIDWSTAKAQEKLDGSLMQLYWFDGAWRVASSGTPDAGGEVNGHGFTFAQLFWRVWGELGYQLPADQYKDMTFAFELMTAYNRVVVKQPENRLVLIGVRSNPYNLEIPVEHFAGMDWAYVREFDLRSIEDIQKTFDTMAPLDQEGYVVVDINFNRLKIKHPGYVALHHLRDNMTATKKNIVDVVRRGEASEFVVHFPEFTAEFDEVQVKYKELVTDLEASFLAIESIAVQKDFAMEAKKTRIPDCMFSLRNGKFQTVGGYIRAMRLEGLVEVLGL